MNRAKKQEVLRLDRMSFLEARSGKTFPCTRLTRKGGRRSFKGALEAGRSARGIQISAKLPCEGSRGRSAGLRSFPSHNPKLRSKGKAQ